MSTIIPTYNRAEYVGQAIESVLRQDMPGSEIIVVDDGSTDRTAEAVAPYAELVRYVRTENRGPAHARNVGMGMAKGEYLSFLDSDDLYWSGKSRLQAGLLDAFPDVGMVSSELSGFDDRGFWEELHLRTYHRSGFRGANGSYEDIYPHRIPLRDFGLAPAGFEKAWVYLGAIFDTYYQRMVVCTNTMMFRRCVLEAVGLQNESFRLLEEHDFALRIAKHCRVAFVDVPTYRLRYHDQQISDVTRGPSRRDGLAIVIEKQRNLLHTAVALGLNDAGYYAAHRELVDRRVAELHRALAVPLMCTKGGAAEARRHFLACGRFSRPERVLALATILPRPARRAVAKTVNFLMSH